MSYATSNSNVLEKMRARHWVTSEDEVWELGNDMVSAGIITTLEGLLGYFEKPWRWDLEHEWWVANGRPDSGGIWQDGIDAEFEVSDG